MHNVQYAAADLLNASSDRSDDLEEYDGEVFSFYSASSYGMVESAVTCLVSGLTCLFLTKPLSHLLTRGLE